jgi:hypothetical protein
MIGKVRIVPTILVLGKIDKIYDMPSYHFKSLKNYDYSYKSFRVIEKIPGQYFSCFLLDPLLRLEPAWDTIV